MQDGPGGIAAKPRRAKVLLPVKASVMAEIRMSCVRTDGAMA